MLHSSKALRFAQAGLSLVAAAVLSACGGGTGGDASSAVATSTDANAASTSIASVGTSASAASSDTTSADAADAAALQVSAQALSVRRKSSPTDATPSPTVIAAPSPIISFKLPALPVSRLPKLKPLVPLVPYINTTLLPAGLAGVGSDQVEATSEMPVPSDIGAFRTVCDFSHMSFDDPIVYPGQPGKSHLHAFFGNTGTDANTTAASIASTGNSTCRGGTVNRTGYWVPAMIDTKDGSPVTPGQLIVYYKTGYNGIAPASVNAFPVGLRMIAGNSASSTPQDGIAGFKCIGGAAGDGSNTSTIPNCNTDQQIWQTITFPQCWDGVNLDSPDHKSHMSYVVQDQNYPFAKHCPSTHPVAVPEVGLNVQYNVTEANSPLRWRLASDSYSSSIPAGYSSHADWFNGWKPDIMAEWIRYCDQASADCHAHLLGNGQMLLGAD